MPSSTPGKHGTLFIIAKKPAERNEQPQPKRRFSQERRNNFNNYNSNLDSNHHRTRGGKIQEDKEEKPGG